MSPTVVRQALLAAALTCAALPAFGDKPTYRMTTEYSVTWLGMPIFKGAITGQNLGKRYSLDFRAKATGLLRVIQRSQIVAYANGSVEPSRYRAERFHLRAKWRKKRRRVDIRFAPDGDLKLLVSPAEPGKRKPVPKALAAAGLDPLTALLHSTTVPLDTKPCALKVPIFDGRRRFDIRLEYIGPVKLKRPVSPLLDRAAIKCRIHIRRVAGFTAKEVRDMDRGRKRNAVIWVSKLRRLKMWMPVRFVYPSRWGRATGRVVKISVAPVPHAKGPVK